MKKLILAIYNKVSLLQMIYRPLRAVLARRRLKQTVQNAVAVQQPLKIVIGANKKFQPGWIPTEIYSLNCLDPDDWRRCFTENSISAMLAEHVWEHLTPEDGVRMAILCFQHLKPGGHLRVAVPDGLFPDERYLEWVKPGGSGPSADDHKVLYNYRTFRETFQKAGFEIRLLEYFDERGEFHFDEWDPAEGKIVRSSRFYDGHQFGKYKYRSLILDAIKPMETARWQKQSVANQESLNT